MPSKSPEQARLMAAAAHNPDFAKKAGVPQDVAREFNQADAGTGILRNPVYGHRHNNAQGQPPRKHSSGKR